MSLDLTDFWPDFVHNNAYEDSEGHTDITKVSDEELKIASAYMVERIGYFFHGEAIGPDDDHAAHYIKYMRIAISNWEWVLAEIERRWKIRNFEADE